MLFYFVRHGQTDHNVQELLAGSGLDLELNANGHAQAEKLAKRLRATVAHPLKRVIASDMKRARTTAEYLARELDLPLQINRDLREWHLGEWEGKTFAEFGHLLLGDGEPEKGESRAQFYGRVEQAWRDVHSDDEPYVIVSHGAVWLALQDILQLPRFKVENCSLVKVQHDGARWRAEIL